MKVSLAAIINSFDSGTTHFKTIERFEYIGASATDSIINSDRYGSSFSVKIGKERKRVKVLYSGSDPLTESVIRSLYTVGDLNMPFINSVKIYEKELKVLTSSGQIVELDLFVTDHHGAPLSSHLAESFSIWTKDIAAQIFSILHTLISRNILINRFAIGELMVDDNHRLSIDIHHTFSTVQDRVTDRDKLAFLRYNIAQLIDIVRHDVLCKKCPEIETTKNNLHFLDSYFQISKVDHYLSDEFLATAKDKISQIKEHTSSTTTIDALEQMLECQHGNESLNVLNDLSDKSGVVAYVVDSSLPQYLSDTSNYLITGEHSEDRLAIKSLKNNKYGFLNFNGDLMLDFIFDSVSDYHEGIAVCQQDNLWGAIDRDGKIVIPFKYVRLQYDPKINGFISHDFNRKRGVIKRKELF